jgi:hypothetical protein
MLGMNFAAFLTLGRRPAGLAGNGTLAVEDSKGYLVPAILGAIAAIHLNVLCWKASAKLFSAGLGAVEEIRRKPAA